MRLLISIGSMFILNAIIELVASLTRILIDFSTRLIQIATQVKYIDFWTIYKEYSETHTSNSGTEAFRVILWTLNIGLFFYIILQLCYDANDKNQLSQLFGFRTYFLVLFISTTLFIWNYILIKRNYYAPKLRLTILKEWDRLTEQIKISKGI